MLFRNERTLNGESKEMLYEINEKALKLESEGKKIIRLNLGDPDLATPPEIVEAAYAIHEGWQNQVFLILWREHPASETR